MPTTFAYIPGQFPSKPQPLGRYLPPIPEHVASAWLQEHLPAGSWVLDPFGAVPHLAVDAARTGYRVLVAANNPIARFLLEMAADPPTELELRSALAGLAASYKGNERIEPHIRSLYMTECAKCGKEIMADAFLWDRGAPTPFGRIYNCPYCGDSGEREATHEDGLRASRFSSSGLHRARALERVVSSDDPDRIHAEEALAAYLPRTVYALFTLINKLDSLSPPSESDPSRHKYLTALLIAALDRTNTLWPYPAGRARPRQLTTPPRFRENNVWLALEEAIELWSFPEDVENLAVPVLTWPDFPTETAGISVFEGRIKDLAQSLAPNQIRAVLAGLPRPNQAYWTLSALWAGWLWGREATASFKSVLRRRRYDWSWHCSALYAAFTNLSQLLEEEVPVLGLMGESEPGFFSAALLASRLAGFSVEGVALRAEESQAQISWKTASEERTAAEKSEIPVEKISLQAAHSLLRDRGEPSDYIYLHAAALNAISQSTASFGWDALSPADVLQQIQTKFQKLFSLQGGFLRFGGSEHSLEVGKWWLRESLSNLAGNEIELPLADRVEVALVRFLIRKHRIQLDELDRELCKQFPGLLTPDSGLIQACLTSYALQEVDEERRWQIRTQDTPAARRADLEEMSRLLDQIGSQLGYSTGNQTVGQYSQRLSIWKDTLGEVKYAFYLLASSVFSEILKIKAFPPGKSLIVFPGGRANLVAYKLENNPLLHQATNAGWRFVKFRQLRRIAQTGHLEKASLDDLFAVDPVSQSDPQIPLF